MRDIRHAKSSYITLIYVRVHTAQWVELRVLHLRQVLECQKMFLMYTNKTSGV